MGLLSPWWLAAGAIGAALPVWLHLLQQHKQDPVQFASNMLMERRTESTTYQRRIKYRLLMALRLLLLLLIALAFAQPFLRRPPAILNAANTLNIIVIDNSFSMRAGERLASARREANSALPMASQAQIWSMGSHVSFLSPITKDRGELTGAISSVGATDEKSSYAELARALRDAARSNARPLKITFITDAQRTAMPPSFSDLALESGSELKVIDVGRKVPNYTVETVNAPRTISDLAKAKVNATLTAFNAPAAKKTVLKKVSPPAGPEMSDDLKLDAERAKTINSTGTEKAGAKKSSATEPKDTDPTGQPKLDSNKLELNKPADADDESKDTSAKPAKKATKNASFPRARSA